MATSGIESLVVINDVTGYGSSRMNSELYGAVLSALIQPKTAKLMLHSAV